MAKGLIKKAFSDKQAGGIYRTPGQIVEFNDVRLKELIEGGFVESREKKPEVKEVAPEVKPEPVAKKTATAKKPTTKKK